MNLQYQSLEHELSVFNLIQPFTRDFQPIKEEINFKLIFLIKVQISNQDHEC